MGWNKQKAIAHLRLAGGWRRNSTRNCAQFTREAIEAGFENQCVHMPLPPPRNGKSRAKDYGSGLIALGFHPVPPMCGDYLPGDVVIIDGFAGHEDGHMAMYDGKQWISDFAQNDYVGREGGLYPGPEYQKQRPTYQLYRYSGE